MNTVHDLMKSLDLKFTSGNDVPVTRTSLSKEEYEVIKKMKEALEFYADYDNNYSRVSGSYYFNRGFELITDKGYTAKVILGDCKPGDYKNL